MVFLVGFIGLLVLWGIMQLNLVVAELLYVHKCLQILTTPPPSLSPEELERFLDKLRPPANPVEKEGK